MEGKLRRFNILLIIILEKERQKQREREREYKYEYGEMTIIEEIMAGN